MGKLYLSKGNSAGSKGVKFWIINKNEFPVHQGWLDVCWVFQSLVHPMKQFFNLVEGFARWKGEGGLQCTCLRQHANLQGMGPQQLRIFVSTDDRWFAKH